MLLFQILKIRTKHYYKLRVEEQFSNPDLCHYWQCYPKNHRSLLPQWAKSLYARLDWANKEMPSMTTSPLPSSSQTTSRPQHVRSGHTHSTSMTLNTDIQQGCTWSNSILRFADNTMVIGLIRGNNELQHLDTVCCALTITSPKARSLLWTSGGKEEAHMTPSTSVGWLWYSPSCQRSCPGIITLPNQRLLIPRSLKKNHVSSAVLGNFSHCAIESIITSSIIFWYRDCIVSEHKTLQQVVTTVQRITGTPLPVIEETYKKDHSVLSPFMDCLPFCLLGGTLRGLWTKPLRNSFFPTVTECSSTLIPTPQYPWPHWAKWVY